MHSIVMAVHLPDARKRPLAFQATGLNVNHIQISGVLVDNPSRHEEERERRSDRFLASATQFPCSRPSMHSLRRIARQNWRRGTSHRLDLLNEASRGFPLGHPEARHRAWHRCEGRRTTPATDNMRRSQNSISGILDTAALDTEFTL